jgi:hypothetical protein
VEYRVISNFLTSIINTIQNTAIASVKTLRGNLYKVNVSNFPKTQEVKGTVVVGNQKNLEKEFKNVSRKIDGLNKDISKRIELLEKQVHSSVKSIVIPNAFKVSNLNEVPKPKDVVIPPYPTTIKIENPQKEVKVTNIPDWNKSFDKLDNSIKSLKLNPQINVASPQVKVTPQAPVIVKKEEQLLSDDPKKYVPVRLTDGKKFYEAIRELVVSASRSVFSDSNGKKGQALIDEDRHMQVDLQNGNILSSFETNDVEKVSTSLTYNGLENKDGQWCVQSIYSVSKSKTQIRFATIVNNENRLTYSSAWTHRASLNYGYFSEVF